MKVQRELSPAMIIGLRICFSVAVLLGMVQIIAMLRYYGIPVTVFGIIFYMIFCFIVAGLITILFSLIKKLHWKAFFIILFSICFCIVLGTFSLYIMVFCICSIPAGYLLYKIIKHEYKTLNKFKKSICYILASILSISALGSLALAVWPGPSLGEDDRPEAGQLMLPNELEYINVHQNLKNPAESGEYEYSKLYYGTENQRIDPYPGEDMMISRTTDGSELIDGWSFVRKWQYGFGPDEVPLNGQVWMPEGDGPFPLTLIVHGNHEAGDRSDNGYDYIGELLASHGIIAVSVDENFLNMSTFYDLLIFASLNEENDARAFVLLEHLQLLYDWNAQVESSFYEKIDFNKLAIIGHSRGGEAAAIASAYSHLNVNPDNGMMLLDYPFSIDTVIAISPTEGMYLPSEMELTLKDVNYMVLHGAQDMDVASFMGANMFRKTDVSNKGVKAQVYIQHANHGQFNSNWGRDDVPGLWGFANNRNLLMTMEEQQEAAKVFIGAFLASTIQNKTDYNVFFEDFAQGEEWLPKSMYSIDFISSHQSILANFDDDFDLVTGSTEGVSFMAEGFKSWKEINLPTRSEGMFINNNRVLCLELENLKSEEPVFSMDMNGLDIIAKEDTLYVSLCSGNTDGDNEISFNIRLTDSSGSSAELPIESFGGVPDPLHAPVYKFPLFLVISNSEPVLQGISIPLSAFDDLNGEIIKMEWIFNTTDNRSDQILYVDDIRVSK